jgi:hypothetical protein
MLQSFNSSTNNKYKNLTLKDMFASSDISIDNLFRNIKEDKNQTNIEKRILNATKDIKIRVKKFKFYT